MGHEPIVHGGDVFPSRPRQLRRVRCNNILGISKSGRMSDARTDAYNHRISLDIDQRNEPWLAKSFVRGPLGPRVGSVFLRSRSCCTRWGEKCDYKSQGVGRIVARVSSHPEFGIDWIYEGKTRRTKKHFCAGENMLLS